MSRAVTGTAYVGRPSAARSGTAVPALEAIGVRKRYGRTTALDGLDLQVQTGQVHGLLGPNGAGKSTAIRAWLGQLRVDSGVVRVLGGDAWEDTGAIHRRLAYVPADVVLWPSLSGGECIDVLGRLQGSMSPARRDLLVDRFDLDTTKRAKSYSKGNRQKVALVAALATDAELFILDEPTTGLDPLMEAVFQDCVREVAAEGRTVLLSSHILGEVEALCGRVSILRRGRIVSDGTLEDLRASTASRVSAVTSGPVLGLDRLAGVADLVVEPAADGIRTTFRAGHADVAAAVAVVLDAAPRSLAVQPPSLDELFLDEYRADGARPDHRSRTGR